MYKTLRKDDVIRINYNKHEKNSLILKMFLRQDLNNKLGLYAQASLIKQQPF